MTHSISPVVSIPDVESHIQAELSTSPSPTSRKVSVPPKQMMRPGVIIPRRPTGRERRVQIFDSQPLSSPLHGASSSPCTRTGLQMSWIDSTLSSALASSSTIRKAPQNSPTPQDTDSNPSTPELSDHSGPSFVVVSSSNDTPPTSIGSVMSGMLKLSMSNIDTSRTCTCLCNDTVDFEEEGPALCSDALQRQELLPTGPSLLSQTAPSDIHHHRNCSSRSSSSSPHSKAHPPISPVEPSSPPSLQPPLSIKIADLGNATPSRKHYAEDIQTRQYRSPEAILGRTDWGHTADMWSVACVIFELLTAEYLFDPRSQGNVFGKDDDHMAQIIELLGDFDTEMKFGGRYSRKIFDSSGKPSGSLYMT